jgi:hypothetical protein
MTPVKICYQAESINDVQAERIQAEEEAGTNSGSAARELIGGLVLSVSLQARRPVQYVSARRADGHAPRGPDPPSPFRPGSCTPLVQGYLACRKPLPRKTLQ